MHQDEKHCKYNDITRQLILYISISIITASLHKTTVDGVNLDETSEQQRFSECLKFEYVNDFALFRRQRSTSQQLTYFDVNITYNRLRNMFHIISGGLKITFYMI